MKEYAESQPKDSISPRSSLSRAEHAYQQLMEAIRSGKLKPGQRIRETDLAEQLQISRTPVREALHRLQSEDLIVNAPHRGLIIAELDYQQIMELYQMREVLESTAAGLAAKHASEPEIYALREMLARQQQCLNEPDAQANQNRLFHNALYHASHNRYLLKSLNSLKDAMVLLGATTYSIPGRTETAVDEHKAMVDAIEQGDREAAEALTREHIRAAQRARIELINQR